MVTTDKQTAAFQTDIRVEQTCVSQQQESLTEFRADIVAHIDTNQTEMLTYTAEKLREDQPTGRLENVFDLLININNCIVIGTMFAQKIAII